MSSTITEGVSLIEKIRDFIHNEITKIKGKIYITKVTKGKRGKEDTIEILPNPDISEEERGYFTDSISVFENCSEITDDNLYDQLVEEFNRKIKLFKIEHAKAFELSENTVKNSKIKEDELKALKLKYENISRNSYEDGGKAIDHLANLKKLPDMKTDIDSRSRELPLIRRDCKLMKSREILIRKNIEINEERLQTVIKIVKDHEQQKTKDTSKDDELKMSLTNKGIVMDCWSCGDGVKCTCE
jgi:hypothetical protein